MKDRCLRNDDIIGSQPKSFTIKKLYLKQQQEKASIFGFPTAISSIKNSPITQYQDIGHNYSKKEEKAYLFKNNIYGFDPNSSQKEKKGYLYEKSAFLIKNDSLDLFQKDFQQKIAENHKENTQKERNYLDNKEHDGNIWNFYGVTPRKTPLLSPKNQFMDRISDNKEEILLREQLLKELVKNDNYFEKNLNSFFAIEENSSLQKKINNSPVKNMQETNYSQFLRLQREMDILKRNKLKKSGYNLINNNSYL